MILRRPSPLLEKTARQGHADAQLCCAEMYDRGEGVERSLAEALMWYERAAEQGNRRAQLRCGIMYYKGEGTAQNSARAKEMLQERF